MAFNSPRYRLVERALKALPRDSSGRPPHQEGDLRFLRNGSRPQRHIHALARPQRTRPWYLQLLLEPVVLHGACLAPTDTNAQTPRPHTDGRKGIRTLCDNGWRLQDNVPLGHTNNV